MAAGVHGGTGTIPTPADTMSLRRVSADNDEREQSTMAGTTVGTKIGATMTTVVTTPAATTTAGTTDDTTTTAVGAARKTAGGTTSRAVAGTRTTTASAGGTTAAATTTAARMRVMAHAEAVTHIHACTKTTAVGTELQPSSASGATATAAGRTGGTIAGMTMIPADGTTGATPAGSAGSENASTA